MVMEFDIERAYGIIHEDYVDSSINLEEMNESDQDRFKKMYSDNKCKNQKKGRREGCCSEDGQCTCNI